ncbi:hypothetical protein SAMN04489806_3313 [Paramicrobacterium humi]|uniref:SGNH hydrolase-type esterase domain-containing protein n=1 Tax=Paramicrobacterium humi TaxID=640635 RepID=A0A1H4TTC5_9MICO|nr:SGNH/GDSL hydrolase family protein [Microbacterium humi]SEC59745.1 hypothetical protein SAMN04489806_3313 [Microbacterium humi]
MAPSTTGDASMPRRRRRGIRVAALALSLAAAASVGAVVVSAFRPTEAPPVAVAQQAPHHGTTAVVASVPFDDAWKRIDQRDHPFVIAVAGDSTGNEPGEWVDLAFRRLAVETDRPLVEHPWNLESNAYDPEITANSDAANAPLIVWNGSASGKTAAYSLEHIDTLLPKRPDILIINHGLNNVRKPRAVGPEFSNLLAAVEQRWPASVGYAVILENPRFDKWHEAHKRVLEDVRAWAAPRTNVLLIDVNAAYLAAEAGPASFLVGDRLHPNPSGSALTAGTVLDALTRAGT